MNNELNNLVDLIKRFVIPANAGYSPLEGIHGRNTPKVATYPKTLLVNPTMDPDIHRDDDLFINPENYAYPLDTPIHPPYR